MNREEKARLGEDTIAALATAPGRSAIAMIRLSGPEAVGLVSRLAKGRMFEPRRATLCGLFENGYMLDDGVVTVYPGPASYTGEDVVEIACHGSPLVTDRILRALLACGARSAKEGEFTRRAFLNGKMDLTQAESVIDLIGAETDRALRAARRMREGELGRWLEVRRERLLQALAHLEAHIDFPEEDISPEVQEGFRRELAEVGTELGRFLSTAEEGKRLREGVRVALGGAPNAGKSSLLNALLQRERAIVSPVPGTTRDTIEEGLVVEGIVVRLTDTAGLREAAEGVEALGIARTREAFKQADLVLWVHDAMEAEGLRPQVPGDIECLEVWNKADMANDALRSRHPEALWISAKTGEGLEALKQAIASRLRLSVHGDDETPVLTHVRHEEALRHAVEALEGARALSLGGEPPELTSVELRSAIDGLGELLGQTSNEDMLDRLFKNFCIGK
jgi:tRNA modification GTPase